MTTAYPRIGAERVVWTPGALTLPLVPMALMASTDTEKLRADGSSMVAVVATASTVCVKHAIDSTSHAQML